MEMSEEKAQDAFSKAWMVKWSAEWDRATERLLGSKRIVMWEVEKKIVAGQIMYEVYKNITEAGAVIKRISGGLFLTHEAAAVMCDRLNGFRA